MRLADLHKLGRLVRAFGFNGSGHMHTVIGDQTEWLAFDTNESRNNTGAEFRTQL